MAGEVTWIREGEERTGGLGVVGLYTRATPVDDTLGSLREVAQRLRDNPWLLDAYPMPADILETLEKEGDALEGLGRSGRQRPGRRPDSAPFLAVSPFFHPFGMKAPAP